MTVRYHHTATTSTRRSACGIRGTQVVRALGGQALAVASQVNQAHSRVVVDEYVHTATGE